MHRNLAVISPSLKVNELFNFNGLRKVSIIKFFRFVALGRFSVRILRICAELHVTKGKMF